ncbi:hypothetical protein CQB05_24255 [Paracidovorax citrulli]|nr:hypothetical protein CQB05_24255 [Paracidovorax citrulli]
MRSPLQQGRRLGARHTDRWQVVQLAHDPIGQILGGRVWREVLDQACHPVAPNRSQLAVTACRIAALGVSEEASWVGGLGLLGGRLGLGDQLIMRWSEKRFCVTSEVPHDLAPDAIQRSPVDVYQRSVLDLVLPTMDRPGQTVRGERVQATQLCCGRPCQFVHGDDVASQGDMFQPFGATQSF